MSPLSCDCYDGCWGDHSQDWTQVQIPAELIAQAGRVQYPRVHAAGRIVRAAGVPHGSYVVTDRHIRVETDAQAEMVKAAIDGLLRVTET